MEVTLVPKAGLCNRINAVLSGIAVHNKYGYPVHIFWEKTKDCYAEFGDLFQPFDINGITISSLQKFYLKPGKKKNLFIPNIIRRTKFDASYDGNRIYDKDFQALVHNNKKIYIESHNAFCQFRITESVGSYFKPIKEIDSIINQITKNYSHNTIGIHIRQTDNALAIKNNPIEKFITLMDEEIKKDPQCTFYLSSDSINIKKALAERYKKRIVPTNWELSRCTVKGMKDATAELYCLGRTCKIIGCTNSTYSWMASQLYNVPLIL